MKQFLRNTSLLKSVVYLLLIGQLCSSTISYCYWVFDGETELIEITNVEDSESEEEDKQEEKKDEIRIDFYNTGYDELKGIYLTVHAKDYLSLHHPEVNTPPPK